MRAVDDIFYTGSEDKAQMLDLFLPEGEGFPVFVYFHGGGLEKGSRKGFDLMARYFTDRGVAFISAEYRMMPSAKYPDFIEDAASAVAWAWKNIASYGGNGKVFVGGSSAGGYLSQMLCFDPRWLASHGIDCTEISGYIHDAGQPTAHFNILKNSGIDSRRIIIDESASLYHIGTLPKYSPMLIIYSDNDMENRPEQTRLLISTLNHFRYDMDRVEVMVMHGKHCQYVGALDPDGESRFARMLYPFIEKYAK